MANNQEVIKEFLVSLGFKIDQVGVSKFKESLGSLTKLAGFAAKAVAGVAIASEAMVVKFSSDMEKLYYASRRTKAAVGNIQALEFGAQQIGISADTARGALESMSKAIRSNPGMQAILDNIVGHSTKGQEGTKTLIELVKQLSKLPHFVGSQFAEMFGIDETTFFMLKDQLPKLEESMKRRSDLAKQLGIDADEAAKSGREFMNSLRDLWEMVTLLGQATAGKLLPYFKEFVDILGLALEDFIKFKALPLEDQIGYWAEAIDGFAKKVKLVFDSILPESVKGFFSVVSEKFANLVGLNKKPEIIVHHKGDESNITRVVNGNEITVRKGGSGVPSANPTETASGSVSPITSAKSYSAKLFGELEKSYGLPPGLLDKMWLQESSRGKNMTSSAGAQGHFQFMPNTGKAFGVVDPNDLTQSATGAARYMSSLMTKYGGNLQSALAAYNWGPGNLDKYGLGAAPSETRNYINKISPNNSGVTLNQTTNINVSGTSDPRATAGYVGEDQRRVNGDLVRNFGAKIR